MVRPRQTRHVKRRQSGRRHQRDAVGRAVERLQRTAAPGVVAPTEQEVRRAITEIPDDLRWEWARSRIVPLFERPGADGVDGDPRVHALTPLGVAIGFGIEVGPLFVAVTESLARRWEASVEQIRVAAFAHLERATAIIGPQHVQHAVHHGHLVRALPEPGGWASSVILAGEEAVTRIFGEHDQTFTVPARNVLCSFDERVPPQAIAEITVALEEIDPHPLLLDPFVMRDGLLSWEGLHLPAQMS